MPKLLAPLLFTFFALGNASACAHTGRLPAGPPPEYEETPLPKGMASSKQTEPTVPAPTGTGAPSSAPSSLPQAPPASSSSPFPAAPTSKPSPSPLPPAVSPH